MKTKPFTNMFGSEVQVTKAEFARRWQDKLFDLGDLFMGSVFFVCSLYFGENDWLLYDRRHALRP